MEEVVVLVVDAWKQRGLAESTRSETGGITGKALQRQSGKTATFINHRELFNGPPFFS